MADPLSCGLALLCAASPVVISSVEKTLTFREHQSEVALQLQARQFKGEKNQLEQLLKQEMTKKTQARDELARVSEELQMKAAESQTGICTRAFPHMHARRSGSSGGVGG